MTEGVEGLLKLEVNLEGFNDRIQNPFWKGLGFKEWKKLEKDSEPGSRKTGTNMKSSMDNALQTLIPTLSLLVRL